MPYINSRKKVSELMAGRNIRPGERERYRMAAGARPSVSNATNRSIGIGHLDSLMLRNARFAAQRGRQAIRPRGAVPLRKRYSGNPNDPLAAPGFSSRDLTLEESLAQQRRQTDERSSRYRNYLRATPTGPDATSRNVSHSTHLIGWTDPSGQRWQQSKETGTVQKAAQPQYGRQLPRQW